MYLQFFFANRLINLFIYRSFIYRVLLKTKAMLTTRQSAALFTPATFYLLVLFLKTRPCPSFLHRSAAASTKHFKVKNAAKKFRSKFGEIKTHKLKFDNEE